MSGMNTGQYYTCSNNKTGDIQKTLKDKVKLVKTRQMIYIYKDKEIDYRYAT